MDTRPPVVSSRRQACATSALTAASKRACLASISSSAAKRSGQPARRASRSCHCVRDRPEDVGAAHIDVRELARRHAEQRTRAERGEPELDARLPAVVRDQGR